MTLARNALLAAPALLAACSAVPPLAAPQIPPALNPPAGQTLYLETFAEGVQIYECARKGDAGFEWTFKAPEASLKSRSSVAIGTHYEGPTWAATDGSTVVGEVKARDPGPTSSAIPWLLLAARTHTGTGLFASTKSIQRVATTGGLAPAAACAVGNPGTIARVPYTATYYFYR